jgi:hypothetical protein
VEARSAETCSKQEALETTVQQQTQAAINGASLVAKEEALQQAAGQVAQLRQAIDGELKALKQQVTQLGRETKGELEALKQQVAQLATAAGSNDNGGSGSGQAGPLQALQQRVDAFSTHLQLLEGPSGSSTRKPLAAAQAAAKAAQAAEETAANAALDAAASAAQHAAAAAQHGQGRSMPGAAQRVPPPQTPAGGPPPAPQQQWPQQQQQQQQQQESATLARHSGLRLSS